jgi:hypothetical protein
MIRNRFAIYCYIIMACSFYSRVRRPLFNLGGIPSCLGSLASLFGMAQDIRRCDAGFTFSFGVTVSGGAVKIGQHGMRTIVAARKSRAMALTFGMPKKVNQETERAMGSR